MGDFRPTALGEALVSRTLAARKQVRRDKQIERHIAEVMARCIEAAVSKRQRVALTHSEIGLRKDIAASLGVHIKDDVALDATQQAFYREWEKSSLQLTRAHEIFSSHCRNNGVHFVRLASIPSLIDALGAKKDVTQGVLKSLRESTEAVVWQSRDTAGSARRTFESMRNDPSLRIAQLIEDANWSDDFQYGEPITEDLVERFLQQKDHYQHLYHTEVARASMGQELPIVDKEVIARRLLRGLGIRIANVYAFSELVNEVAKQKARDTEFSARLTALSRLVKSTEKVHRDNSARARNLLSALDHLEHCLINASKRAFAEMPAEFSVIDSQKTKFVYAEWRQLGRSSRRSSHSALFFLQWLSGAAGSRAIKKISNYLTMVADTGATKVRMGVVLSEVYLSQLTSTNSEVKVNIPYDLEGVVAMLHAMGLTANVQKVRAESADVLIGWS
jgi:hypothetical protein